MDAEDLRRFLRELNVECEEKRVQHGTQFRCIGGEKFTVYTTGRVVPGGTKTELSDLVDAFVRKGAKPQTAQAMPAGGEEIFIVYGHDTAARNELELILRRIGFSPIVLGNLAAAGETIIEKLETYIGQGGRAKYACVLLTPDDEGYKAGTANERKYRARQNVVLELGMVLAKLGRKRVAILRKKTVEQPSDIDGLIYIPFDEHIDEDGYPLDSGRPNI
jgi:predicted nucleotide-binding protein